MNNTALLHAKISKSKVYYKILCFLPYLSKSLNTAKYCKASSFKINKYLESRGIPVHLGVVSHTLSADHLTAKHSSNVLTHMHLCRPRADRRMACVCVHCTGMILKLGARGSIA